MIYRAAKALYEDWQSTDSEIEFDWETAPPRLRRTFIRKATVALEGAGIVVEYGVGANHHNDEVVPVVDKSVATTIANATSNADVKFRYRTGWISATGEIILEEDHKNG